MSSCDSFNNVGSLEFQAFNAYKIQRQKDEKEEARLKTLKSKEDFEQFLMNNERISSTTKYFRIEEMFGELPVWKSVQEGDRKDIYQDCVHNLQKKEKETSRTTRKKNTKRLAQILDTMTHIKYNTTWEQVRQTCDILRRIVDITWNSRHIVGST